jgi:DNA helicase II / ATP-dependent DNA helicase PcrA
VRVGDSNQAIYETFTTADPRFLRNFLKEQGVEPKDLANSGRSSKSIISLANHLIEWTVNDHPAKELRGALSLPFILPSPAGDPQPNPQDNPKAIHLGSKSQTPTEEAQRIVENILKWLPSHENDTVAVLVPRNERGAEIVELLKNRGVPYIEMLRSTRSTRQIADALARTLESLADPASPVKLSNAFRAIAEIHEPDPDTQTAINKISRHLRDEHNLETLFTNDSVRKSQESTEEHTDDLLTKMEGFIEKFKKWHAATLLPIDQLVLTISQDIFTDETEYALAYKIAGILDQSCKDHPEWHLPDFAGQLSQIASNQRKFIGFSEEDTGFDPDAHRGQVVVSTIHKAKGLEWDRVYLVSVNNYDFPALQPEDSYIGEKWFIKDKLNLSEELQGLLDALVENDPVKLANAAGQTSLEARIKYSSERLRLLYVGITRARRELVISWNTGRQKNCTPALALQELTRFWKEQNLAAA